MSREQWPLTMKQRFYAKVAMPTSPDACWEWSGAVTDRGYGSFWRDGRMCRAHRLAYEMHHGPIPAGRHVDHICRTRTCVNPSHLRLLTNAENQQNRNIRRDNSSGVTGVYWVPSMGKWRGSVKLNGREFPAGYHLTIDEAAEAVARLRKSLHPAADPAWRDSKESA